jgi:hypothetical protein
MQLVGEMQSTMTLTSHSVMVQVGAAESNDGLIFARWNET